MKLNKPPVSEEQTILEEYVGFLLTDLSNVHPIGKDKNKKISDLVAKQPRKPSKKAPVKQRSDTELKNSDQDAEITQSSSSETEELMQNNTAPSSAEPIGNEALGESPKWSTIEEAASKRRTRKQFESEKEVKNKSLQSSFKEPEVKTAVSPEIHDFVEECEEDQLKEWDALITQEKEQEILSQQDLSADKEVVDQSIKEDETVVESKTFLDKESLQNDSPIAESDSSESDETSALAQQTREIIADYLPVDEAKDPRLANVEKLLSRISLATMPKVSAKSESNTGPVDQSNAQAIKEEAAEQAAQAAQATFLHREAQRTRDILPEVFQTLIFQVGKLPLAVPLLKLGGIIKVSQEDITPLVGTPDWFMGLVPNDRGNLMVVDTQHYLMPEQVNTNEKQDYQYLILLDNSNWALACHSVGDAKNLTQDDIRWSEKKSNRPWFAGMVVDYMSALLEVDDLINMLADNIVE